MRGGSGIHRRHADRVSASQIHLLPLLTQPISSSRSLDSPFSRACQVRHRRSRCRLVVQRHPGVVRGRVRLLRLAGERGGNSWKHALSDRIGSRPSRRASAVAATSSTGVAAASTVVTAAAVCSVRAVRGRAHHPGVGE